MKNKMIDGKEVINEIIDKQKKEKDYHFEVIVKLDFIITAESEEQAREVAKDTWEGVLYDEELKLLKVSETEEI